MEKRLRLDKMEYLTLNVLDRMYKIEIISGNLIVKAYFRKCRGSVQNYCFDSKIDLPRSFFLHIKFHTFLYGQKMNFNSYFRFY